MDIRSRDADLLRLDAFVLSSLQMSVKIHLLMQNTDDQHPTSILHLVKFQVFPYSNMFFKLTYKRSLQINT